MLLLLVAAAAALGGCALRTHRGYEIEFAEPGDVVVTFVLDEDRHLDAVAFGGRCD